MIFKYLLCHYKMTFFRLILLIAYLLVLFEPNQSQPFFDLAPDIVKDGVGAISGFMKGLLQFKSKILENLLRKQGKGMLQSCFSKLWLW